MSDEQDMQWSNDPVLMLKGARVGLGPVTDEHLPLLLRWFNDPEVTRGLGNYGPFTLQDEQAWYETTRRNDHRVPFAIYELATGKPIGNCDLHNIDRANQRAEFGIAIGDKAFWNKGYGTEATQLLLDYAFNIMNLHNVMLIVYAFNARAQRAYEKAGFRFIGKRRAARLHCGKRYDEIYMDAVADEFASPFLVDLFERQQERPATAPERQ